MNKKGINPAYLAQAGFNKSVVKRNFPTTGFHVVELRKTASASGNQVRQRNWKLCFQKALACLVMAALFDVIAINFLFFPDCNRTTRDCFLVQHLWGAK